jgi:hypothetical protein
MPANVGQLLTCRAGIRARDDFRALAGDPGGQLEQLSGVAGQAAHHQRVVAAHHKHVRNTCLVGLEHGWKKSGKEEDDDDVIKSEKCGNMWFQNGSRLCDKNIINSGEK